MLWKSQLQTEIALSSTESEHVGLSHALRDAIPTMNLLNEMQQMGCVSKMVKPEVKCKAFEDDSGALEMAKVHKHRPRTKHTNAKYHHFRDCVERGEIKTLPIESDNQLADHLTKPVNQETLERLRKRAMGW